MNAFSNPSPPSKIVNSKSKIQNLIDPLSERELDALRLLNTHLSGPEIAAELIVPVNTVKTHIKRIYSKLDAGNRNEGVGIPMPTPPSTSSGYGNKTTILNAQVIKFSFLCGGYESKTGYDLRFGQGDNLGWGNTR